MQTPLTVRRQLFHMPLHDVILIDQNNLNHPFFSPTHPRNRATRQARVSARRPSMATIPDRIQAF